MKNRTQIAKERANDPIKSAIYKYNTARSNLLLASIFSILNIFLLLTEDFTYFLFSAAVPYLIADLGMYICGRYPEEFYEGGYGAFDFFNDSVFYALIIAAFVIIAFYILCYFLSKNGRVGWLIAALVAFSVDTLIMFSQYNLASSIIDILFHAYVIVFFVMGIKAHYFLKKMESNAQETVKKSDGEFAFESLIENTSDGETENNIADSTPIRTADFSVKSRVFLEKKVFEHTIIYRRVKKVNELIIDGFVYDEYIARMEFPHILTAVKDGREISAGIDIYNVMTITVDGQVVADKRRFF